MPTLTATARDYVLTARRRVNETFATGLGGRLLLDDGTSLLLLDDGASRLILRDSTSVTTLMLSAPFRDYVLTAPKRE